jgi:hypothetical protein
LLMTMMGLLLTVDNSVSKELPSLGSVSPIGLPIASREQSLSISSDERHEQNLKRKRAYKPRRQKTIPFLAKLVQLLEVRAPGILYRSASPRGCHAP